MMRSPGGQPEPPSPEAALFEHDPGPGASTPD